MSVKTVMAFTGAGERTVKNWFEGKNGPNGENLVELVRHSDEVLEALLWMADREDILAGKLLVDARDNLVEMLEIIDQLQSDNSICCEGEVLEFFVQSKRNARATLKLMRKLLRKQGWAPTRITTDKLRSHHVVIRTRGLTAEQIDNKRADNRAENSHQALRWRERKQQRFKSSGSAQRLLNIQSAVYNNF